MIPDLILKGLEVISLFGSVYFAVVVLAVLWLKKDKKLSLNFVLAFLVTNAIVYGLKFIFQVPRPQPTAQGPQPFYNTAFPSGHSARGFLYAVFLSEKFNSNAQTLFYSAAVLTAIARVLNGEHYQVDAIFGSIIGFVVGAVFMEYKDKILKFMHL